MNPDRTLGYAAATRPLAAHPISTDTTGLEADDVKIDVNGFSLPAYYARPAKSARAPVLLVIQEIFGVHEYIKDVCRRLGKEGYFAIAPELYARQGNVAEISDMSEIIQKVVSKVPDRQVLADLDATVEYVKASGKGDTERLGIVGFCWGGRIVWLYAAHQPKLKAGAAWYGKLAAGAYSSPEMQPKQPLDIVAELHGSILGLYGGQDEGIPLSDVAKMRQGLSFAGKAESTEIVVYPQAGHAFHADYRPSYHEASAKYAWAEMLGWFQKYI